MDILLKLFFPDGTEYFKTGTSRIVGGGQASGGMSTPKFSFPCGQFGEFQASHVSITLPDPEVRGSRHLRDDIAGDKLSGVLGEFYQIDASDPENLAIGDLIWGGFIESWIIGEESFRLRLGNQPAAVLAPAKDQITLERFPNASEFALGRVIPQYWGSFHTYAKVVAPRVSLDADAVYLLTKDHTWSGYWTYNITLYYVFTPSGTDVTASCTLVTRDADDTGYPTTGTYIKYTGTTEDYLIVFALMYESATWDSDVSLLVRPDAMVLDLSGGQLTILAKRGMATWTSGRCTLHAADGSSSIQNLTRLCKSFGLYNYSTVSGSGAEAVVQAKLVALDLTELTVDATIESSQVLGTPEWQRDPARGMNAVNIRHSWDGESQSLTQYNRVENKWLIEKYGLMEQSGDYDAHYFARKTTLRDWWTWSLGRYLTLVHGVPPARCQGLTVALAGDDLADLRPGSLIDIDHPGTLGAGYRLHLVESVRGLDLVNGTVSLDVLDVEHLRNYDKTQAAVLTCEGEHGSQQIEDWAIYPAGIEWVNYGVTHTRDQKPSGAVSALNFDGTSTGYLVMNDSFGWNRLNILENTQYTLALRVRRENVGAHETLFSCAGSTSGYWGLYFQPTTNKVRFQWSDGVTPAWIESSVAVNDNNWHDIILFRDGTKYAIYIDGAQTAYRDGAITGIISGGRKWYFGRHATPSLYFDGQIYWPAIVLSNPLSLNPTALVNDMAPPLGIWRPTGHE